jgi:hypothetical protein
MIKKLALAAAVFVATLCISLPASAQNGTINISLDGFCNTFSLTTTGVFIAGTRSGCGYTVIDGGAAVRVGSVLYHLTGDTNDGSELFTWYFTQPIKGHGNWYLYTSDGTTDTETNSGTYSRIQGNEAEQHNGKADITKEPKRKR